jgi:hypothetical protein
MADGNEHWCDGHWEVWQTALPNPNFVTDAALV